MIRLLRAFVWGAVALLAATLALAQPQPKYRIVIMPKLVGIAYYDAVKTGIDAAARELPDVSVTWIGPTQDQVERQIEMIERLIGARRVAVVVVRSGRLAIGLHCTFASSRFSAATSASLRSMLALSSATRSWYLT